MTLAIEVEGGGEGEHRKKEGGSVEVVGDENGDEGGDGENTVLVRLTNLITATPPISIQPPMGHHHRDPLPPKSLAYRSYIHRWPHKYFTPQEKPVECMACDKEGAYFKCTNCTLILCDSCKEIIVKQECGRIMGLVSAVARWKLGYKRHGQNFADVKARMEHHAGGDPVWYTPLHLKTVVPHSARESSCLQWELHYEDTDDGPSDLLTATLMVAHTS